MSLILACFTRTEKVIKNQLKEELHKRSSICSRLLLAECLYKLLESYLQRHMSWILSEMTKQHLTEILLYRKTTEQQIVQIKGIVVFSKLCQFFLTKTYTSSKLYTKRKTPLNVCLLRNFSLEKTTQTKNATKISVLPWRASWASGTCPSWSLELFLFVNHLLYLRIAIYLRWSQ